MYSSVEIITQPPPANFTPAAVIDDLRDRYEAISESLGFDAFVPVDTERPVEFPKMFLTGYDLVFDYLRGKRHGVPLSKNGSPQIATGERRGINGQHVGLENVESIDHADISSAQRAGLVAGDVDLANVGLFDAVQSLIPENIKSSRPKAQKYSYLLTGLLKCHCGCSMSPASAKGGRYHYYVCGDINCRTRVKAEKIEAAVLDQLARYRSDDALLDRMEQKLIKAKEEFLSQARPEMEEAISARREATLERDKVYKVILTMNTLNDAGFLNDKLNSLTREIDRLTAKIDMLNEQTKDTSIYDDIHQELYVMRNTAKLLTEARAHDDRVGLRKMVLTHISKIENIGENRYRIEPSASSSNCKEWWCTNPIVPAKSSRRIAVSAHPLFTFS